MRTLRLARCGRGRWSALRRPAAARASSAAGAGPYRVVQGCFTLYKVKHRAGRLKPRSDAAPAPLGAAREREAPKLERAALVLHARRPAERQLLALQREGLCRTLLWVCRTRLWVCRTLAPVP